MTCPCTDSPISNYSAEDPDLPRFFSRRYWTVRPKLGTHTHNRYLSLGCMGICYSPVSQQAADDCALAQAQECATDNWDVPDGPNSRVPFTSSRNAQQSCNYVCPNGTISTFVQQTGTVFGFSPFMANFWAYALACQRARRNRICLSKSCEPICLNGTLNCLISADWNGSGAEWTVSGLPVWATATVVGNDLFLNGTADTAGNTDVIVVFTTPQYNFATLAFQIKVLGITNATALPDATPGTAYSQQLAGAGGTAPYSYGYESGTLPAGVTVNAAGLISGTPATPGNYSFNLYVRDSQGQSCFKDFTLKVATPDPDVYWKLDGPVPALGGKWKEEFAHAIHLSPVAGPVVDTGIILSCLKQDGGTGYYLSNAWPGNANASWSADHFTIRGWAKGGPKGPSTMPRVIIKFVGGTSDFILDFVRQSFPVTDYVRIYQRMSGIPSFIDENGDCTGISTDGWNHLVATWNETTKYMDLYCNAVRVSHVQHLGLSKLAVSNTELRVGWISGNGWVDEVGLWKGFWDQTMVTADYNAGAGKTFP